MTVIAQQNARETARAFVRQGDYTNAILVLNRAIENDSQNIDLKNDLAFAYYLQRDYNRAVATLEPVLDDRDGDVQSYQVLGLTYRAMNEMRDAERMYRNAIRRFPDHGALYNDYGELLWSTGDFSDAAKQWIRGIHRDPTYSGNYFNAARYYYMSADKAWGLIYGEMFLNLESYSSRTPEAKHMLVEGYKKLFADVDMTKNQENRNEFVKSFLNVMKSQAHLVSNGITADALSAVRTRFLLEWFDKYAAKFPFRLFEYQRQLAKSGLFDAYNQWIFSASGNLSAFQQWTTLHSEEYNRFVYFQKNRVFKVPKGQHYHYRH